MPEPDRADPAARSRPGGWRDLDLVCPRCRGPLEEIVDAASETALRCGDCDARYPVLLDIPDLRVRPDPYIGYEDDRAKARMLAEACAGLDLEAALTTYYRKTSVVTDDQATAFTRSVLAAEGRAADTLAAVAERRGPAGGALLDLGCGTAPLAAAAARSHPPVVGVDIAFRWLAMAQVRLRASGVSVPLICACAEALPFADETFDRVIGESMIEHVADQTHSFAEIARVLRPGGDVWLTTPNRWSLGPDPHVGLPAGGYLPDAWIAAYIRRRGGIPPARRLLSDRDLRAMLRRAGLEDVETGLPDVPSERRASLSRPLALAATAYSRALRFPPSRALLRRIGPLLSASAVKPGGPGTP